MPDIECPDCHGTGEGLGLPCRRCGGTGNYVDLVPGYNAPADPLTRAAASPGGLPGGPEPSDEPKRDAWQRAMANDERRWSFRRAGSYWGIYDRGVVFLSGISEPAANVRAIVDALNSAEETGGEQP